MTVKPRPHLTLALRDRVTVNPSNGFPYSGEVRAITRMAKPVYAVLSDAGELHQEIPAENIAREQEKKSQ